MPISSSEALGLEIAERVTSVCSVLGAAFIISTFLLDRKFRKPINRLVFFAAWGNLFANVATLISRDGIKFGSMSPTCQFQAFLIHWFLPADALWIFAMACNVYLSFFRQYDAGQLRGLEWKYLVLCYGLPFVPALAFLFIQSGSSGKVYGDAVLWCWVSPKWSVLRIASFYGPVWLVILVTMFIYVKVGVVVFRWRRQLISLSHDHSASRIKTPANTFRVKNTASEPPLPQGRYGATISSQVPHPPGEHKRQLSSQRNAPLFEPTSPSTPGPHDSRLFPSTQETSIRETQPNLVVVERPLFKTLDANKATLSYCKTAMLFFVALLCTWVPSTVNRLYTLIEPDASIYGLDLASGTVLPLQGFWNTIIYITTSLPACRALWREIKSARIFQSSRSNHSSMGMGMGMGMSLSSNHSHGRNQHRPLGSEDTRAENQGACEPMSLPLDEGSKEVMVMEDYASRERDFAVAQEDVVFRQHHHHHHHHQQPDLDPYLDPNFVHAR